MTSDDIKDLPPIIDQFLNSLWLEDGLSKNTLNSYRYDLKQLVAWYKNNDIVVSYSLKRTVTLPGRSKVSLPMMIRYNLFHFVLICVYSDCEKSKK